MLDQVVVCEDAIKTYHVIEGILILGASYWVIAKYSAKCGYREGCQWAAGQFSEIFGSEKMSTEEQNKVVDFIMEKEKRCGTLI